MSDTFDSIYIPEPNSGCFIWLNALSKDGYGSYRHRRAHRVAYERMFGPIPNDLTIDHLCRVRSCVNPRHLEVVTMGENMLRGVSPAARQARTTHCIRGHPYDYLWKNERHCKRCGLIRARYRRQLRAYIRRLEKRERPTTEGR